MSQVQKRNKAHAVKMSVNPDLQKERATATFPVPELTDLFNGGPDKTRHRKKLESLLWNDPVFDPGNNIFQSDTETYERTVQHKMYLSEFCAKHGLGREEEDTVRGWVTGTDIHWHVFIPTIEALATEEQKRDWLPKALSWQMIGTYCQTELGHGTNLRRLETTAEYDPATQEFVLNTPKLTSMKWWPGGLGKTVNHALVMAQLLIGGRNHGMQAFLVPIRQRETHMPLPGVEVGWIGPIFTRASLDNGYLRLHNVRIPRTNMLMKYSKVAPDGTFSRSGDPRVNYASMVRTRVLIIENTSKALAVSVTIATRYSAVRRQSELRPGATEPQILEYQTQQHKIFPQIASAYAFNFVGNDLLDRFHNMQRSISRGDFSDLPELHSLSAGLKAYLTELQTTGTEVCRRACGGHGYMLASGLPGLLAGTLAVVTAEGENTVMYLQTARYLLKMLGETSSGGKPSVSCAYLAGEPERCAVRSADDCQDIHKLLPPFYKRAHGLVNRVGRKMATEVASGTEQHMAWDNNSVALVRAAKAHLDAFVVATFAEKLRSLRVSPSLRAVLSRLGALYALHRISQSEGEFLQTGAVTADQLDLIQTAEMTLFKHIRPDAVALVDAFDFHDLTLNSALGAYDGQAYERLYESAKRAPINKQQVSPAFYKYIKPLQEKAKL